MFDGPSEAELKASGLTLADLSEDLVTPWPENEKALQIFGTFATQWITGPGGVIGWNYLPAMQYMAMHRYKPARQDHLLGLFRVIESEALAIFREQSE